MAQDKRMTQTTTQRALAALITTLTLTAATAAQAQPTLVADSGDTAWVLAASFGVLALALSGLVLIHGRGASARLPLLVALASARSVLVYALLGYTLAFGPGSGAIGDFANTGLRALAPLRADTTISEAAHFVFQLACALTAVGIVVTALGVRARVVWLSWFAPIWLLLVYVPVSHWLWAGGWLAQVGAFDTGGGLVVQLCAGAAVLGVAPLLGRHADATPAVASDACMIGGLGLWWAALLALAGGAALGASDGAAASIINLLIGGSAAVLLASWLARRDGGDVAMVVQGTIAGLAAVSVGGAYVGMLGAVVLGLLGVGAAMLARTATARIDRAGVAHAFASHGAGAIAGGIMWPIAALPVLGGPGFDQTTNLLNAIVAQAVAVAAIALWSAIVSVIAALIVSTVRPIREVA